MPPAPELGAIPPGLADTWWPISSAPPGHWVEVCGPGGGARCKWWLAIAFLATGNGRLVWVDHTFNRMAERPTHWRLFRGFPDGVAPR